MQDGKHKKIAIILKHMNTRMLKHINTRMLKHMSTRMLKHMNKGNEEVNAKAYEQEK